MKLIRLATTQAAFHRLPASWFKTSWTLDLPSVRLTFELLARVGNGLVGPDSCWVEAIDDASGKHRARDHFSPTPRPSSYGLAASIKRAP